MFGITDTTAAALSRLSEDAFDASPAARSNYNYVGKNDDASSMPARAGHTAIRRLHPDVAR
jgi:hypothetical protein